MFVRVVFHLQNSCGTDASYVLNERHVSYA